MGNTMEFVGESEAQAVENACAELGIAQDALDYTVVDEGSDGVLGFGSRPVQIRVRTPDGSDAGAQAAPKKDVDDSDGVARGVRGPAPEKAAQAEEVSRALLERMGLSEAGVEVRDEDEQIVVVITEAEGSTEVATVLGTPRPPAIPSFQFLLNKIVNRFPENRKHIVVEVPSVPKPERRSSGERRSGGSPPGELDPDLDPTLVEVGRLLAERAVKLNRVITIHPMLPGDRRAVHQTIMVIDGVSTTSEGEGLYRKMHVVPDSLGGGASKKKRRRRRRRRRPEGEDGGPIDEGSEAFESAGAEPSDASP